MMAVDAYTKTRHFKQMSLILFLHRLNQSVGHRPLTIFVQPLPDTFNGNTARGKALIGEEYSHWLVLARVSVSIAVYHNVLQLFHYPQCMQQNVISLAAILIDVQGIHAAGNIFDRQHDFEYIITLWTVITVGRENQREGGQSFPALRSRSNSHRFGDK